MSVILEVFDIKNQIVSKELAQLVLMFSGNVTTTTNTPAAAEISLC